ncbi:hypothetical protein [Paenibacillus antibioticophila]|uniref:hypothetical protein n=1 Tax=Paenibacillus antibioticophila TaxID=1274374 RepID=UPI001BB30B80|nr:hypothetical protein [Paenibacillus antibioticophila]
MKILREVISLNRDRMSLRPDGHELNEVGQEERMKSGARWNAGESSLSWEKHQYWQDRQRCGARPKQHKAGVQL